jgi:hypothetical protein
MSNNFDALFSDPLCCQDPMIETICEILSLDQKKIEQQFMDSKTKNTFESCCSNKPCCSNEPISDEKQSTVFQKKESNELVTHLYHLANEDIGPLLVSRCSVKVLATFGQTDASISVKCILDTGAEVNIMTQDIANELGLQDYIDTNYVSNIQGVGGSGRIVGYLPYVVFNIGSFELKSNFMILDNSNKKNESLSKSNEDAKSKNKYILFGMSFMMFYGMELNFKQRKLTISGHEIDMIIDDH